MANHTITGLNKRSCVKSSQLTERRLLPQRHVDFPVAFREEVARAHAEFFKRRGIHVDTTRTFLSFGKGFE